MPEYKTRIEIWLAYSKVDQKHFKVVKVDQDKFGSIK